MSKSDDDFAQAVQAMTDDQIGFLLESIRQGNKAAVRSVLETFVIDVDAGRPSDARVLEFLADGLQQILDGEDPRQVFRSSRDAWRPDETEKHRDLAVEVAVRKRDGMLIKQAKFEVAQKHHVSEAVVRKAYDEYGEYARKHATYLKARKGE